MKIRCNLRVTILFLRLNLSLLHLGPVQIPRLTPNLELRPIEVQKSVYFDWSEFLCVWLFSWRRGGLCLECFEKSLLLWNRRKSLI